MLDAISRIPCTQPERSKPLSRRTQTRTRFAPSPSGLLHAGHGYSALTAHDIARKSGGAFVLRIEDIDVARCRSEFEDAILEDLAWLGLEWEEPVRRQSEHFGDYEAAIERLTDAGLTYPCFCTRKEIAAEIEGAASAPHGPDGPHYPGTCKGLGQDERQAKVAAEGAFALRLDSEKAVRHLQDTASLPLHFEQLIALDREERVRTEVDPHLFGDIVLARKDIPTSYHVSVVVDDHLQNISHVIRGEDLREATHIHAVLQGLFGFEPPVYFHHPLVRDDAGRRLAKRDRDQTLRALRDQGVSPGDVRARIASSFGPDGDTEKTRSG